MSNPRWFLSLRTRLNHRLSPQNLGIDKLVASLHKRLGRLLFAEAIDRHPFLAQASSQPGEIAVAGHQAKAIEPARIEQVHRINDQRAVGGVLALGISELLDHSIQPIQQFAYTKGKNELLD